MPQRIVDHLEAVEIDEQHGELPLVAAGRLDGMAQQPVEHFPVGQFGQAVMRGEVLDPFVRLLLLVGPAEIFKRQRDIGGEPLQQFDELRREGVLLDRNKQHDANDISAGEQRKRGAG